ncbi:MAG: type IV secretory system conjugative DNA transfer family protein, partial [bacterium]
ENERSSVISSAIKFLNLYRDPTVAANTAVSDFAVSDLVEAERPVSLYLTVPPSDIDRTRPLIRLVLNQIGRRLTESLASRSGELERGHRHRLLLMLDEFPTLGRLPFFENALSYLPGYGVKAYLIAQDLSQLYGAYGRDESIVSNCHVRIAYAPNKIETAKLLSEMTGSMTVFRETRSYTGNRLAPFLFHVIASEQESQRPLLTPDEAMRLPDEAALVFVAGSPPIFGRKIRYFLDPIFRSRSSLPSPRSCDVIGHDWSRWIDRAGWEPLARPASELKANGSPNADARRPGDDLL